MGIWPRVGLEVAAAVAATDEDHEVAGVAFSERVRHNKPLYSFEDNADYVYDVMWSPVHPALFACVDGMGRLDLWNLNNDTETFQLQQGCRPPFLTTLKGIGRCIGQKSLNLPSSLNGGSSWTINDRFLQRAKRYAFTPFPVEQDTQSC
ncbi:hypothetical protein P7K49_025333 [Saguinus oedipus]|uniref:Uncharacterized protein n=1 Tax=Saguinus oedipus TaxID=9490 RepID=A0ABQ9UGT6_SAGOE|nr:hypothetical protein P7K49_025333 [Saguinus oedipus]